MGSTSQIIKTLSSPYAVDITQTDDGDVYVACGANLKVNYSSWKI